MCAVPSELTAGAQASALALLAAVASAGPAVAGAAAAAVASGLSSVALAAEASAAPRGRKRLLLLLGAGADRGLSSADPGSTNTLVSVFEALDALSSSLQAGFTVPGETPSVLSADALYMVSRLDSSGADSRLFSEALSGPLGSAFDPLPADSAGLSAAAGGVQTQFLVTMFR